MKWDEFRVQFYAAWSRAARPDDEEKPGEKERAGIQQLCRSTRVYFGDFTSDHAIGYDEERRALWLIDRKLRAALPSATSPQRLFFSVHRATHQRMRRLFELKEKAVDVAALAESDRDFLAKRLHEKRDQIPLTGRFVIGSHGGFTIIRCGTYEVWPDAETVVSEIAHSAELLRLRFAAEDVAPWWQGWRSVRASSDPFTGIGSRFVALAADLCAAIEQQHGGIPVSGVIAKGPATDADFEIIRIFAPAGELDLGGVVERHRRQLKQRAKPVLVVLFTTETFEKAETVLVQELPTEGDLTCLIATPGEIEAHLSQYPWIWSRYLGSEQSFAVLEPGSDPTTLLPGEEEANIDAFREEAMTAFVAASRTNAQAPKEEVRAKRKLREVLIAGFTALGYPAPMGEAWLSQYEVARSAKQFQEKLAQDLLPWLQPVFSNDPIEREEIDRLTVTAARPICFAGRSGCGKTTAVYLFARERADDLVAVCGRHGNPIDAGELPLVLNIVENLLRTDRRVMVVTECAGDDLPGSRETLRQLLALHRRARGRLVVVTSTVDEFEPAFADVLPHFTVVDVNGGSRRYRKRVLERIVPHGDADEIDLEEALDHSIRLMQTTHEMILKHHRGLEYWAELSEEPWATRRARLTPGARIIVDLLATIRRFEIERITNETLRYYANTIAPQTFEEATVDDAIHELKAQHWIGTNSGEIFFPAVVADIFAPSNDGISHRASDFTHRFFVATKANPKPQRELPNLFDLSLIHILYIKDPRRAEVFGEAAESDENKRDDKPVTGTTRRRPKRRQP